LIYALPLILREVERLRVLENEVLRIIFGYKEEEVTEDGGNYVIRSFIIRILNKILLG
jgi:hypothetical protein